MSSNTYKGKAAYFRIFPDPAKAELHWELLLLLFVVLTYILYQSILWVVLYGKKKRNEIKE